MSDFTLHGEQRIPESDLSETEKDSPASQAEDQVPERVDYINEPADEAPIPPGHVDVTTAKGSTWRIVLMLAWPVLAQQFLVLLVGLSDSFLAGNYQAVTPQEQVEAAVHRLSAVGQLGAVVQGGGIGNVVTAEVSWQAAETIMSKQIAYQSAQTTAMYLAWFLSSFTNLVTIGSTALVARSIGARDRPTAIRFTNQSILLAATLGLVGSILGLTQVGRLVHLLQLHGDSAQYAVDYLLPMFALLVFQVVEMAGIACFVGAGDTRTGLWVFAGVAVLNIPLSWGLCIGISPLPKMGFVGISVGTAVSHMLGGLVVLALLLRGHSGLELRLHLLRPDFHLLYRLLRISVPAAVDSLSVVICQFWYLSIVNQLGDVASSAHGVAIRWEALGFLSGVAFGTAAMTLVGQNLGARQPQQASRSGWVAFGMGCLLMSMMGLLFFVLARPMFLLFFPYPWQHASVVAGVPVLRLIALAQPALASAIIFTFALRGAGDTTFPVFITWIGFLLVRIPVAYWLALPEIHLGPLGTLTGWNLGLFGAWMAMFADLILRGGLFMFRFRSGAWQRIKV